MRKIVNKFPFFAIVVISFILLYPSDCFALLMKTSYVSINETQGLDVGDLSFSNISFKDYSSTSTLSFGLSGMVKNNSNDPINYNSTVYYYDSNYNLVAKGYDSKTASVGISNFDQMSNLSILKDHSVDEISYYSLIINTAVGNLPKSNSDTLTPNSNSQYGSYDYVLNNYDVDIVVNENNTLDVTEKITAYFNVAKHGIFRTIPIKNTVKRLDGTTSTNHAQILNVSVNDEYTKSIKNGYYKLQIGSKNRTLVGAHDYVIKYTYNLGKDPVKDYDELYYNIIGTDWNTLIGNVTFSITMPKEFDSSKLGFSSGLRGSVDNSKISYNVSGNKITGSYNGVLNAREALTIRCELPEGYFVDAGFIVNKFSYLMFIIPVLCLIISAILWYVFGRDDKVIETVEFYPPDGLNSLDIAFLYKGKATNKDVTSLLIFLANKGYIEIIDGKSSLSSGNVKISQKTKNKAKKKIIELQDKINKEKEARPDSKKIKYYENMLNIYKDIDKPVDYKKYGVKPSTIRRKIDNKFIIKKLKDYDGTDVNEGFFLEGMFKYGKSETNDHLLYNKFYKTMRKILHIVNDKNNKKKIFEKGTLVYSVIVFLLIIISVITTISVPTVLYDGFDTLITTISICAIYMMFVCVAIFTDMSLVYRILLLGFIVLHSTLVMRTFPMAEAIINEPIYLLGFIVGVLCLIGMGVFFKLMPKRTPYGIEMLGKIRGFRNFLKTVEKEKLESLVMQNPNYFYDILPYTYVLGISNKWIKKFESISLQEPSWYYSSNEFDVLRFGTFMNSTMSSANSAMSSNPSSGSSGGSFSGGSSGGGFSGGGSGGGGGGSW